MVLSGNDPYLYRYWVERLAERTFGPFDIGVLADLPTEVTTGEPLLIVSSWWVTEVFGGSAFAAGVVLAIYPVVSALLGGIIVYSLGGMLSGDNRVGLAALGLFAVTPGHAFRTGLGFADHHAFDYVWLAITLLGLVSVLHAKEDTTRSWMGAFALGVGVAGQALAWEAGPLLLLPAGIVVAVVLPFTTDELGDRVPFALRVVSGFGIGTVLTGLSYAVLGWPQAVVAVTPFLLFVGALGILGLARLSRGFDITPPLFILGEVIAAIIAIVAVYVGGRLLAPSVLASLVSAVYGGIDFFVRLEGSGIGETISLTGAYGPVAGPLIMLGYAVFLGLPVTIWAVWNLMNQRRVGWTIVSIYVWYFLGLSLVQRRFTGELAIPLAVVGGLGFVTLLGWLELARPPTILRTEEASHAEEPPLLPSRRRATMIGGLSLIFASFPTMFTWFIHRDLTIDETAYRAAKWMQAYSADLGWDYPRNYVFSHWGRNRMFNYFVSGESRSYAYAQEHYSDFLQTNVAGAESWFNQLQDRTGFVLTRDGSQSLAGSTLYAQLHGNNGSGNARLDGSGHFRAVYSSRDGELKVFTLVPGATIHGVSPESTQISIESEVTIPNANFTYRRTAIPDEDGEFSVRVAHPGSYRIGDSTVSVSEGDIRSGASIEVSFGG